MLPVHTDYVQCYLYIQTMYNVTCTYRLCTMLEAFQLVNSMGILNGSAHTCRCCFKGRLYPVPVICKMYMYGTHLYMLYDQLMSDLKLGMYLILQLGHHH